jgi:hypothetical protein
MNWPSPLPEQVSDAREEIERSYHFDDLRLARRVGSEEFIAAEYVAMMSTASPDGVRAALLPVCGNAAPDRQASRGPHLQAQPDDLPRRSPKTLAAR